MIAIAAPNIGKETSKPIWVDASDRYKGTVKMGDPVFERFIDAGKMQATPSTKNNKSPAKKAEPVGK